MTFSVTNACGKNVFFGVENSSSVHTDDKKKNILVLSEGPTQGLDDTSITAEAKYYINFTESRKIFALSLLYNGNNSFFLMPQNIYQMKANYSEMNPSSSCFGSISTEFEANNTEDKQTKKTGLNEHVCNFSVDYIIIYTCYIIDINKYLMKKAQL